MLSYSFLHLDSKMSSMRRSGGGGAAGNNIAAQGASAGSGAAPGQVVIADPNRLVPVQITIPAQVRVYIKEVQHNTSI